MRPSVSVKGAGNGAQGGELGSRGRTASSSSPHGSQGLGCCSVDVSSVRPSVDVCSVSGPVRMLAEEPHCLSRVPPSAPQAPSRAQLELSK